MGLGRVWGGLWAWPVAIEGRGLHVAAMGGRGLWATEDVNG